MKLFYKRLQMNKEKQDAYWQNMIRLTRIGLSNLSSMDAAPAWNNWGTAHISLPN